MMQKIADFDHRTNTFSSPTLVASNPSSTMIGSLPLSATSSSLGGTSSPSAESSTESSTLNSPLSPTSSSSEEDEIMLRSASSSSSGLGGLGGGGVGGMMGLGGRSSGSPFPFPAIMSVSADPKTPAQFLMGLGVQILEGRLPDHKQAKGFLEGDHCTSLFKSVSHFCDFETNPLCRQLASLQFLLLSDPSNFTLEVSLIPKHGISNNTTNEYNTSTSSSSSPTIANNYVQHQMLIEKWRVSLLPQEENECGMMGSEPKTTAGGGAPPIVMTPRNLHNAVRSFLHFSQLAAWLSKKKEFSSAWKVRIDIGDTGGGGGGGLSGSNGNAGLKEGWDRHEFPAVTLESPGFSDTAAQSHQHQHFSPSPTQRGWSKGRSNSKWTVKVTVDSLPRMDNFPPLPAPVHHHNHYHFAAPNNSITNTNNTTINKPCLSSSTSSTASSSSSSSSSPAATSTSSASLANSSQSMTNNKSQLLYGGISGMMMLEGNEENVSGVRIRFRGGRSRRSHASGGNNGSSSHRSRPKNLRIAIPDMSQSFEEDADIGSFNISSNGTTSSATVTSSSSSTSTATSAGNVIVAKNSFPLLGGEVHPLYIQNTKIPFVRDKLKFESSLNRATTIVFHKSGLPLTSSPAPIRKPGFGTFIDKKYATAGRFDFDSSLLPKCSRGRALGCPHFHGQKLSEPSQSLLGSFEESVLNGRIEPVSTVEGFTAEVDVGSSHNFKLPVTVFFYTFCDNDRVSSPYSAHVTLSPTMYPVPRRGTVQVTLYNPMKTVVKMFVINYDLSRMPANSHTFIRQKILFMPLGKTDRDPNARKWLRYLIHLRFGSSPNGDKIYLHKDIRMIVLQKSDADTAVGLSSVTGGGGSGNNSGACQDKESDATAPYELRSFTYFADVPPSPFKQYS